MKTAAERFAPSYSKVHDAVIHKEKKQAKFSENVGKIIVWLKANPLSTADEVFKAVGIPVGVAQQYTKGCRYNGNWCYRVNNAKIEQFK